MESGTEILLQSVRKICPNVTNDELAQFASKFTFEEFDKKDFYYF